MRRFVKFQAVTAFSTLVAAPCTLRRCCVSQSASSLPADAPRADTPTIGAQMLEKGFHHSTPNFSVDFGNLGDPAKDLGDLETRPVGNVNFGTDLHGPWLIMTEELQGELFVDHDGFTYYRPASSLGYGIGQMSIHPAGVGSTAFVLQLESYSYENSSNTPPLASSWTEVSGAVKLVMSKSSNYETYSLAGMWRRKLSRDGKTEASGQFNAAKLNPWVPSQSSAPWKPPQELRQVFEQVFPKCVVLSSHLERAEALRRTRRSTVESSSTLLGSPPRPQPAHIDLEQYRVGDIPDIFYIPNYISEREEACIVDIVKNTPKELKNALQKRTVQEWGCSMCEECKQSFVSDANMPPWLEACTDTLVHDGIFTPVTFPNSVRIHEYHPGDGIGPHCDGPIYVPNVTILSLASPTVMSFYPRRQPYDQPMEHYNDTFRFNGAIASETPLQSIVLEPRSLLIFRGDAYHYTPHGVLDKHVDTLDPSVVGNVVNRAFLSDPNVMEIHRQYRISLTTRNLLPRCSHQPQRAEYFIKRAWYVYNQLPIPDPLFPEQVRAEATASGQAGADSAGATTSSSPTATVEGVPATAATSATEIARLTKQLDGMAQQQAIISRDLNDIKQVLATHVSTSASFRAEMSSVLNHLSSTMLEVDNKLEDLSDNLDSLRSK